MKRAKLVLGIVLVVGVSLYVLVFGELPLDVPSDASAKVIAGGTYDVVRVIDGDTFVVSKGGKDVRVRLIGIDAPETADARTTVECFGKEASGEAKRLLEGERIRLELDSSQGEYDKYYRLLAYAFLESGPSVGLHVNEHLVSEGFAREYTYAAPYIYKEKFEVAEQAARAAGRGLWAPGACAAAR